MEIRHSNEASQLCSHRISQLQHSLDAVQLQHILLTLPNHFEYHPGEHSVAPGLIHVLELLLLATESPDFE